MNVLFPKFNHKDEFQWNVLVWGTILFSIAYLWPVLLNWGQARRANQLEKRLERIQNGATVITVYDINTNKNIRYLPIGTVTVTSEGKEGPMLLAFVDEDHYEEYLNGIRGQIVAYWESKKEKKADESAAV